MKYKYILSADCIPVKGYLRSIIIDLGRNKYFYIPNHLNELLADEKQIDNLINEMGEEGVYKDYFKFLVDNEILLKVPEAHKHLFPKISESWEHYAPIMRCYYEVCPEYNIEILKKLEESDLFELNIIATFENLNLVIDSLADFYFQTVNIYIDNDCNDIIEIKEYLQKHPDYYFFMKNSIVKENQNKDFGNLFFVNSFPYEESIKQKSFHVTISLYTESIKHNSYYNGTIFIRGGNILNTWNGLKHKGIFLDYELSNIHKDSYFKNLWNVSKDMITVCKDCEYRNICIDNRVIHNRVGYYYFEKDCNYNPFISKWRGENGFVSIHDCGELIKNKYYPDLKIINQLYKELWGN